MPRAGRFRFPKSAEITRKRHVKIIQKIIQRNAQKQRWEISGEGYKCSSQLAFTEISGFCYLRSRSYHTAEYHKKLFTAKKTDLKLRPKRSILDQKEEIDHNHKGLFDWHVVEDYT